MESKMQNLPQYPPSYGQQYGYDQPPAGYPPQQGYGYGGHQQTVVVAPAQPQPIIVQHPETYIGHIVFSCIVFFVFCNPLFGLIAFILAMVAISTTVSDPVGARKLGYASLGVSISGIVVNVIIIIVVYFVVIRATEDAVNEFASSVNSCSYYYEGTCYENRKYLSYYDDDCSGVRGGNYCYYN